jgi:sRNA-binding protein
VTQQEAEEENLQKRRCKKLKAAAALYKKQQLAEAKVEQERIKKVKKKKRKKKTKYLAASRGEKQGQKGVENTQKALQLSQRGKKLTSEKIAQSPSMRMVQLGCKLRWWLLRKHFQSHQNSYLHKQFDVQTGILNSTKVLHM